MRILPSITCCRTCPELDGSPASALASLILDAPDRLGRADDADALMAAERHRWAARREARCSRPSTSRNSASSAGEVTKVLYSTGIRRFELAGLKLFDVDVERGALMVRQGKGSKDRLVPLGDRACAWVDKYLRELRPELATGADDYRLFLDDDGRGFTPERIGDLVRRQLTAAGIEHPGSCHLFRVACATHMLENGADIRFIQSLLGHAKLDTRTRRRFTRWSAWPSSKRFTAQAIRPGCTGPQTRIQPRQAPNAHRGCCRRPRPLLSRPAARERQRWHRRRRQRRRRCSGRLTAPLNLDARSTDSVGVTRLAAATRAPLDTLRRAGRC